MYLYIHNSFKSIINERYMLKFSHKPTQQCSVTIVPSYYHCTSRNVLVVPHIYFIPVKF